MTNEAFDIRRARGHVLTALRSFYPNAVSGGLIFRNVLSPLFTEMEWTEALQILRYLEERSLIEGIVNAGLHQAKTSKDRLFRLTAQGVDVASRVVADPTLQKLTDGRDFVSLRLQEAGRGRLTPDELVDGATIEDRRRIIGVARNEYRADPSLSKITDCASYVSMKLQDRGLGRLSEGESLAIE